MSKIRFMRGGGVDSGEGSRWEGGGGQARGRQGEGQENVPDRRGVRRGFRGVGRGQRIGAKEGWGEFRDHGWLTN